TCGSACPISVPLFSLSPTQSTHSPTSFPYTRSSDLELRPDAVAGDDRPRRRRHPRHLLQPARQRQLRREVREGRRGRVGRARRRSEEHTSELQSRVDRVCRLLLEKKKRKTKTNQKKKKKRTKTPAAHHL